MSFKKETARLAAAALLLAVPSTAGAGVKVLASILPLQEFAARVAGPRADVRLFLPPGAGVHTWQPRPADIVALSSCDLFISVGAHLEPWLGTVLTSAPGRRMRVLEVSRGLPLLPAGKDADEDGRHGDEHGTSDPHVWLDPELDLVIVDAIARALAEVDPAGRPVFEANADALKARLRDMDGHFRRGLADCRGRRVVVAGHAAFGYLAARYGLVQTALVGPSADALPGPGRMMAVIALCRQEGIKAVFHEASAPSAPARTLARDIGGRVFVLNAGQNLTRDEIRKGTGFFDLMEANLESLRRGLDCR